MAALKPFSVTDFVPNVPHSFEATVNLLNNEFNKLVKEGYYTQQHSDFIQLILSESTDLGESVVTLRKELTEFYKLGGWLDVVISTSDENGERPGLVGIKLYKGPRKQEPHEPYYNLIRKEVGDIKACLIQMPIQRVAQQPFESICISLDNLGKIADAMEK